MSTTLVWVLVLISWDGGITKFDNISNWEDCERVRKRVEFSTYEKWNRQPVVGTCTQVGVLVPTSQPTTVNVSPPQVTVKVTPRITVKAP